MNEIFGDALLQQADALLQLIPRANPDIILSSKLKDERRKELLEAIEHLRLYVERAKREGGIVWHPLLGHIPADSVKGQEVAKSEAA